MLTTGTRDVHVGAGDASKLHFSRPLDCKCVSTCREFRTCATDIRYISLDTVRTAAGAYYFWKV